jgi:hypothetical protein
MRLLDGTTRFSMHAAPPLNGDEDTLKDHIKGKASLTLISGQRRLIKNRAETLLVEAKPPAILFGK